MNVYCWRARYKSVAWWLTGKALDFDHRLRVESTTSCEFLSRPGTH